MTIFDGVSAHRQIVAGKLDAHRGGQFGKGLSGLHIGLSKVRLDYNTISGVMVKPFSILACRASHCAPEAQD